MPLTNPWHNREADASDTTERGPNRAREREPARDRARAPTSETSSGQRDATVVPHPAVRHRDDTRESGQTDEQVTDVDGASAQAENAALPAQTETSVGSSGGWRRAVAVWVGEACESAQSALDGSAWRVRPPALRDLHARFQRADWAGDSAALRAAGVVFGWVSLSLTAVGYGLLWVVRRPLRLLVSVLIAVVIVVSVL